MAYIGGQLHPLFDVSPTHEALDDLAETGGDALHDYVARNTPIHTGNLRTSWYRNPTHEVIGITGERGRESRVSTDVDYAPYVEHGTGLYGPEHRKYLILPKTPGGVLSWEGPTGRVFAKRVWHPGSPGAHMMSDALAKLEVDLDAVLSPPLHEWARKEEARFAIANRPIVAGKL